jgi:hypothetical protein
MQPPVPESDIDRESVALDEAIARIEAEIGEASSSPPFAAPAPLLLPPSPAPSVAAAKPAAVPALSPPAAAPAQPAAPTAAITTRPPAPGLTSLRSSLPPLPPRPPAAPRPALLARPAPATPPGTKIAASPAASAAPILRASRKDDDLAPMPTLPSVARLQVLPITPEAPAKPDLPSEPAAAEPAKPIPNTRAEPRSPDREEAVRPAAPRPLPREPFSPRLLIVSLVAILIVGGIAYTAWRLRDRPEALARARAALENTQKLEPQAGKIVSRADGSASAPTILADPSPVAQKAPSPAADQAPPVAPQPPAAADNAAPANAPPPASAANTSTPAADTSPPAAPAPADNSTASKPPAAAPDQAATPAVPASNSAAQPDQPAAVAPPSPPAAAAVPDQAATLPASPTPDQAALSNPGAGNAAGAAPAPAGDALPVSQRAALLVDAPTDPQKVKTYVGTVVWRVENVSPGQGQPLARAVRAEIDVQELNLKLSMLLQKNFEQQFPASHTIELRFTTPPGNPLGNVKQINVPQLRSDDQPTGDALAGVPVTITDNYFLVGLTRSNVEANNLNLLKSRNWIDIPFYFTSGTLAKITFEKGQSGQHVIEDAIQSWQ